jgi:hypothetical protein
MKINKPVRIRFLRDRALVATARVPFAFTHELPKNAKENADGTAGGVWGGMPCRPPLSAILSPFSGDPAFFAILRQYLNKVRTFFAENPESHE